jgi:hypothetical protein
MLSCSELSSRVAQGESNTGGDVEAAAYAQREPNPRAPPADKEMMTSCCWYGPLSYNPTYFPHTSLQVRLPVPIDDLSVALPPLGT